MLSKKTKYGIKALTFLGRQEDNTPIAIASISKCDDCPDENACSVHKLMIQVRDNTLDIFRNTSLADLCNC